MASYNNHQYGPPVGQAYSSGQQRQQYSPTRQDDYHDQGHHDQYYDAYDSQPQPSHHDADTHSPDLHPGFSSSSRSPQYYNQSPRSRDAYGPPAGNNTSSYAAGAGAGAAAGMAVGGAYGNLAKYGAAGGHCPPTSDRSNPEYSDQGGRGSPYSPYHQSQPQSSHASYSSADLLTSGAAPPPVSQGNNYNGGYGNGYPQYHDRSESPSRYAQHSGSPHHPYYNQYDNHSISRNNLNGMEYVDPNAVIDDGDDGLNYGPKRQSRISLTRRSMGSNPTLGAAGVGAAGAAVGAGTAVGAAGTSKSMYSGAVPRGDGSPGATPVTGSSTEKHIDPIIRDHIDDEERSRKKKKVILIIIGVLIILGIIGGVVGALLVKKKGDDAEAARTSGQSANNLDKQSGDIKKLLGNKNLHRVFMGMAYTPFNTQYPDCLSNPPSQNNVTKDIALLSQLTNVVRLYGTDCNQTEMVLTAIDKLGLTDTKVWVGVWLDNNSTTSTRQVKQLWDIIDKYGTKYVKGVVVGNEVLFRKDLTSAQLKQEITYVRNNMTSRSINLPIASSDLGDNWTADLASAVDVVMSNVHPFFGGVAVNQAASWTWSFWQTHDVVLTANTPNKQNVISEIGWPSGGGNDCGAGTCVSTTDGAVAGIDQMNTFMNSWVCQALTNGTQYFWFELTDQPWKVQFNTPGKEWEDKWGLFTPDWNLKPGIKIPDCGGKSVPALS